MHTAPAEPNIIPNQTADIISTYLTRAQELLSKYLSSEEIIKIEQDIQEQEKCHQDSSTHLLESYRHMANLSNEKSMFQLSLKYYKKYYQLEVLKYQKNSISLVPTLLSVADLQINLALFKEANETLEECFDIFKDKNKDNTLYMDCKMTEAYLLYEQGKYEASLTCLEKCERVHLDTNIKLKFEFLSLEAKLHSLLSHINKMRKFVKELFKETESLGGNNETIYSKVFSLAAYSYFIEGKYETSREYYLKSIKLALEAEPVDFKGIINSLLRLSHLCLVEGTNDLGIVIAKEAHSLCLKIFDESHCLSVTCMAFLGKVYREQCDFNQAIGILENSMKARIDMFGENSPFVLDSYIKMGEFFLIYTKYNLALEFLEKALKIHKILYDEKNYHFGIAGIYNLLGLTYLRLRNFNAAEENFSKAFTNMNGLFGDDHPSVADYYGNLSIIQGNYQNRDRQLEYLKKTLSIQKKCLGRYHAKTAPAYENLGDLYSHRGEFDKAIRKCKKGIEIRIRSFGMSHPTICDTYFRLGLVYKRKGDNGEAIKCIMKALKVNLKFYPVPNRRNLALFNNLTTTYRAKGDIKEAEKFGKILADIKRVQENVNAYATLLDALGKDMDRYEFSQCFL